MASSQLVLVPGGKRGQMMWTFSNVTGRNSLTESMEEMSLDTAGQSQDTTKKLTSNNIPNEICDLVFFEISRTGNLKDLIHLRQISRYTRRLMKEMEPKLAVIWARRQEGNTRVLLENLYVHADKNRRGFGWLVRGVQRAYAIEYHVREFERVGGFDTMMDVASRYPIIGEGPAEVCNDVEALKNQVSMYLLGAELVSMVPSFQDAVHVWTIQEAFLFGGFLNGLKCFLSAILQRAEQGAFDFTNLEDLLRTLDTHNFLDDETLEALVDGCFAGGITWLNELLLGSAARLTSFQNDTEPGAVFERSFEHYHVLDSFFPSGGELQDTSQLDDIDKDDILAMNPASRQWSEVAADEQERMKLLKRWGWSVELPKSLFE